jgi:hypothetical protein
VKEVWKFFDWIFGVSVCYQMCNLSYELRRRGRHSISSLFSKEASLSQCLCWWMVTNQRDLSFL